MNKKIIFFLLALLLAGCSACAKIAEPVEVKVPIAVACKPAQISEPDWNLAKLNKNVDSFIKLKAALADLQLSRGYIHELEVAVKSCE